MDWKKILNKIIGKNSALESTTSIQRKEAESMKVKYAGYLKDGKYGPLKVVTGRADFTCAYNIDVYVLPDILVYRYWGGSPSNNGSEMIFEDGPWINDIVALAEQHKIIHDSELAKREKEAEFKYKKQKEILSNYKPIKKYSDKGVNAHVIR